MFFRSLFFSPEGGTTSGGTDSATTKSPGAQGPKSPNPGAAGKGGRTDAPAPTGGPRAEAPEEHMSAFERAKARRGSGAANVPASDSPAAGLSSGKTTIQKTRENGGKSALQELKERSRKHNPQAKTVQNEVVADESAMPGKGPNEVEEVAREDEPEVEPMAAAPGEETNPDGSAVSTPVGDHTAGEGVEPAAPAADGTFTPATTYKAFGKEHAIPERFQSLITDETSQKEVQDVFERAHGIDQYKTRLTQIDHDFKTKIAPEIEFHRQTRDMFNQLIQRNDVFGILGKMGLPREKVLQAVADRIRIEQLPPEQRAMYDAREAAQAEASQAASQTQAMQTRIQQLETLAKNSLIESTFARGDVRTVADDFDNRLGRQGAFEELVRDHGALMYSQGKDITPGQAVQAVMERFGLTFQAQGSGPARTTNQAPKAPTQVTRPANGNPPTKVIPNIASRAAATTSNKPQVNNLSDLRKLRAQMRGR